MQFTFLFACVAVASLYAPSTCASEQESPWKDSTAHRVEFVPADRDVRLEVLDWGGTGQPVVLLTGSGHTAHVFDDFAPKLLDCCHVYGITRRGYGHSSRPAGGYDDQRLADDVLAVIDRLQIRRPVLVGHSMAGGEMTTLGRQHSDRLSGLVYLDALGDLEDDPPADKEWLALQQQLPAGLQRAPLCPVEDRSSFAAYRTTFGCRMGFLLPESELRQGFEDVDGAVGPFTVPQWVGRAIGQGQVFRRDYSGIRVPVLALMNDVETTEELLAASGYQPKGADERARIDRFMERSRIVFGRFTSKLTTHVVDARVKKYPLAGHYLFLTRESDVLHEIHTFVAGLRAGTPPQQPTPRVDDVQADPSPHRVQMITVDSSVQLEVLDWGGNGRPLVFVGCYLSAHVFDDIAPKLRDRFHVYALTRRGVGASDAVPTGYDPQRRADDVFEVMEALDLRQALLVGNACGGHVLHTLGAQHPERIGGLVYLDAAEDPTLRLSDYAFPPVDRVNQAAFRGKQAAVTFPPAEQHRIETQPLDPAIRKAITEDHLVRPEYAAIKVPVLAIYRSTTLEQALKDFPPASDVEREGVELAVAARRAVLEKWQRDLIAGVPTAKIVELPGANLYMFLSHEREVMREIRAFAATLDALGATTVR